MISESCSSEAVALHNTPYLILTDAERVWSWRLAAVVIISLYLSSENTLTFEYLMEKPNFISCKVSHQVYSSTAAVSEALLVNGREYP